MSKPLLQLPDSGHREEAACSRNLSISVIIPVRNEAETVAPLLQSLAGQTLPPAEVVIVDGGSTDGTPEAIEAWQRRESSGLPVCLLQPGEATPGRGRNIGAAAAENEWIAFTDAGIRLDREWLFRLAEPVNRDPGVQVVYGHYEPEVDTFFTQCASLAYVPPLHETPGGRMRGPSIACTLIRKTSWEQAGGFPDFRAGEDLIFMERLAALSCKVAWAPGAVVRWSLQPTLLATFRRFLVYSRANVWAGRQWDWHYGIARQYAAALPFWFLAVFASPFWALVPASGLALRALRGIWRRREGHGPLWILNPVQWAAVAAILLTIDLATFAGWAQAVLRPLPTPRTNA